MDDKKEFLMRAAEAKSREKRDNIFRSHKISKIDGYDRR